MYNFYENCMHKSSFFKAIYDEIYRWKIRKIHQSCFILNWIFNFHRQFLSITMKIYFYWLIKSEVKSKSLLHLTNMSLYGICQIQRRDPIKRRLSRTGNDNYRWVMLLIGAAPRRCLCFLIHHVCWFIGQRTRLVKEFHFASAPCSHSRLIDCYWFEEWKTAIHPGKSRSYPMIKRNPIDQRMWIDCLKLEVMIISSNQLVTTWTSLTSRFQQVPSMVFAKYL